MNTKELLQRAKACLNMNWKDDSISPQEILDTMHSSRFRGNDSVAKEVYYHLMLYYKELNCETQKYLPSVAKDCIMTEYNRQKGIEL